MRTSMCWRRDRHGRRAGVKIRLRLTPVVVAALSLLLAGVVGYPVASAAGRAVTLRTESGRTIPALYLEAERRPAPAVVLVPMLGRTKDDWQGVAQRLAETNISTLAIDLPGSVAPADANELAGWNDAVAAAVAYLATRPSEINAAAIGVAGASLGGSLAAVAAAVNPAVRSLALISPSLDYRGLRIEPALEEYGARPVLLVASQHDPYAARSARALAQSNGRVRQLRWSSAQAHGTMLLAQDPDLVRSLVEWFQLTLA